MLIFINSKFPVVGVAPCEEKVIIGEGIGERSEPRIFDVLTLHLITVFSIPSKAVKSKCNNFGPLCIAPLQCPLVTCDTLKLRKLRTNVFSSVVEFVDCKKLT
jgi:hypothetical protein